MSKFTGASGFDMDFSIHNPSIGPRESVSVADALIENLMPAHCYLNNHGFYIYAEAIERAAAEIKRLRAEVQALHPTTSGDGNNE
jgi:hypothetical protein